MPGGGVENKNGVVVEVQLGAAGEWLLLDFLCDDDDGTVRVPISVVMFMMPAAAAAAATAAGGGAANMYMAGRGGGAP